VAKRTRSSATGAKKKASKPRKTAGKARAKAKQASPHRKRTAKARSIMDLRIEQAKKLGQAKREAARRKRSRLPKSPLAKSELNEFRDILIAKRRALIGDMNGIQAEAFRINRQEGTSDLSNMPTHPADIGTDNYEQEFTLGLLESERAMLMEINEALDRIEDRTYGVCLGTGKPISKARLRARPWAKYSIEYARMLEKGLVRPPMEDAEEPAFLDESDEQEED